MRLGRILWNGNAVIGLVVGDEVLILNEVAARDLHFRPLAGAADVTALWAPETRALILDINERHRIGTCPGEWRACSVPLAQCHWLPPVKSPEKIICIGLNYRDHAEETKGQIPREPVLFSKFNNTLTGAEGPVVLPSSSSKVDYEAELAFVIGKEAKRVPADEAMAYVGGYFILDDVSARDWQFKSSQWLSGKTFDTFAPCGPYLVTPDEILDPHSLRIRLVLNGTIMQDSNTHNLLFGIPVLISYISSILTLRPGDIISTGTPAGVDFAKRPPVFLRDGDEVEISIEGIGSIRHRFIAER
jgi:2-keto-4-pentenoate hydratase/2-oxohepta-3-ene-1,7-dioic acid hydratase in catechol pathway